MRKRAHFRISGRVQGVCYRMAAVEEARGRNLTGWVRNLSDGRVEVVVEGEEEDLASLLEWCRSGPPLARVTRVDTEYSDATGEFNAFTVAYGSGWR